MAIVHVVMKSSSTAPPSAAHAQYIAREGQYEQRGGLELVESGNMPEFARENPQAFWEAADAFERANGRAYTELQIALPRELNPEQRNELAREATREFLGERFAYTMAVHTPLAKDNIEQPHMHLMFSERVVDSNTQSLSEERFFKRNGAKKDPDWHNRDKPMEVREKWVETMNAAMAKHGQEQQLDARSWVNQGREDLAALREEKTLHGDGPEAVARHAKIDRQRQQRAELPMPGLSVEAATEQIEKATRRKIAELHQREAQELSRLDRLIAAARELAVEVKERAVAVSQHVADGLEKFRERMREMRGERKKELRRRPEEKELSPARERRVRLELGPGAGIEEKRQAFREWRADHRKEREATVPEVKQEPPVQKPERSLEKDRQRKPEVQIDRGFSL